MELPGTNRRFHGWAEIGPGVEWQRHIRARKDRETPADKVGELKQHRPAWQPGRALEHRLLAGYLGFHRAQVRRRAAIARYASATYPVADRIVKIRLLSPTNPELLKSLEPIAATSLQTFTNTETSVTPDHFRAAWECVSLALLEYRRDHFQPAAQWCRRCLAYPEVVAPRAATAQIILAMADWRLGNADDARKELAAAREVVEAQFKDDLQRGSAPNGFWFDWVFARILLREAQGLMSA